MFPYILVLDMFHTQHSGKGFHVITPGNKKIGLFRAFFFTSGTKDATFLRFFLKFVATFSKKNYVFFIST